MREQVRVIILDDDEVRARDDWAARILDIPDLQGQVDVKALSAVEVAQCLSVLEDRSLDARSSQMTNRSTGNCIIDDADIVIIDYDLTPDPSRLVDLNTDQLSVIRNELRAETAESVAYLARCYSRCRYIVAVNQFFRQHTFDLTFQKFIESRADLNISQDEIGSAELWTGSGDGYRPWSWPKLIEAGRLFERRVAAVELDAQVLQSLQLLPTDQGGLDARQLDALGDAPDEITFREVAKSFELGLMGRDQQDDESILRRIAAGGIGRWLDRTVLPAQNVLVDAPHLAYRAPSLMTSSAGELESWNATSRFGDDEVGLNIDKLAPHKISACDWSQRPAWSWSDISRDESIPEISSPWTSESYDFVFAEDISRFIHISDSYEIQTDLPGPYSRRYISRQHRDSVHYLPPRRIME